MYSDLELYIFLGTFPLQCSFSIFQPTLKASARSFPDLPVSDTYVYLSNETTFDLHLQIQFRSAIFLETFSELRDYDEVLGKNQTFV